MNNYDIGFFSLTPKLENYRYALPNKLFEFIQARLAIAIWPSVEMKKIVDKYDLGLVSKDYDVEELANMLNALTVSDIDNFKLNSHKAAEYLNESHSKDKIRSGVCSCLQGT